MTTTAATGRPARNAGRPRSAEADEAIINATLELVADKSTSAVSIEAIAAAAGVGKTTIYRRWDSKEKLIVDALASIQEPLPTVSGDSLRDDLVMLVDYIRKHNETMTSKLMVCVMTDASDELRAVYIDRLIEPRRELMRQVIRRGIDSGELQPDLDVELTGTLLSGPMLTMLKIWKIHVPEGTAERIVDSVLNGIRSHI